MVSCPAVVAKIMPHPIETSGEAINSKADHIIAMRSDLDIARLISLLPREDGRWKDEPFEPEDERAILRPDVDASEVTAARNHDIVRLEQVKNGSTRPPLPLLGELGTLRSHDSNSQLHFSVSLIPT